ncbi:MAG: GYF domain-containing protein [Chthoniobacterales bacterium]
MPILSLESWYLRKHGDNEIFGPVHFNKIKEWAESAQIAPHDMVSEDGKVWTKAPMIPELEMDWLVQLSDESYYGPTTIEALLEFLQLGEINDETPLINCTNEKQLLFGKADFFPKTEAPNADLRSPQKRSIRHNLQQRIRELELTLVEKNRQLQMAEEKIQKLDARIRELPAQK